MNSFVEWKPKYEPNGAIVMDLEGVEESHDMRDGVSFKNKFSKTACFRFDPDRKKNVEPVDFIRNVDGMILCSEPAKDFIHSLNPPSIEYLPVKVLDHKKKALNVSYFIIHPVDPVDCIDLKTSEVTWSAIDKKMIQAVDHLVIDAKKVPEDRLIFRPTKYSEIIIMRREFAEAIVKKKFSGARWVEIK